VAMKIANIAELKNRLSEFLGYVMEGEEVEVRKRNFPVARLVPIRSTRIRSTGFSSLLGASNGVLW
jgi:prevent-host-death family protein